MTHYTADEIKNNDEGWLFYDSAFKCWKEIYNNIIGQDVLDIGCASGTMLALTAIFNPSLKLTGYEIEKNAKEMWIRRKLTVKSGLLSDVPDKSFDTVYTSHVLEHCENPQYIINDSIRLARKRIIHVVPDGNVDDRNFGSPHLHIFNRKNFMTLFQHKTTKQVLYKSITDTHISSIIAVYDVK